MFVNTAGVHLLPVTSLPVVSESLQQCNSFCSSMPFGVVAGMLLCYARCHWLNMVRHPYRFASR